MGFELPFAFVQWGIAAFADKRSLSLLMQQFAGARVFGPGVEKDPFLFRSEWIVVHSDPPFHLIGIPIPNIQKSISIKLAEARNAISLFFRLSVGEAPKTTISY